MKRIRIAELKARLSEPLRYVRRGNAITVLDRDTPVARIIPLENTPGLAVRKAEGVRPLGKIRLSLSSEPR